MRQDASSQDANFLGRLGEADRPAAVVALAAVAVVVLPAAALAVLPVADRHRRVRVQAPVQARCKVRYSRCRYCSQRVRYRSVRVRSRSVLVRCTGLARSLVLNSKWVLSGGDRLQLPIA